ncbi:cephalosporin hydroxylase family protein [Oceanicaulis alexandrii]|uniref:cephalosporin hydroxylase family protein n=1 Tax=Oceanicaulis alexandrii TaxID=153233 RepID=UPI003B5113DE
MDQYETEVRKRLQTMSQDADLESAAKAFLEASIAAQYSYNFNWLGVPIIQYPQDIMALQEIVWQVRPDVIVETGIARGGSLSLSASLLALLDLSEMEATGQQVSSQRRVIGVDIDIRPHTRQAIDKHPFKNRITMIEGSSVDTDVIASVRRAVGDSKTVLVCLDSHHGHDHVLQELEAYAPLVSVGSYCIVFDTIIDDLEDSLLFDRPWGPGDNPKTAVESWLKNHNEFEINKELNHKLQVTVAKDGYLIRKK